MENQIPDDELSDEEHMRHLLLGGHAGLGETPLTDDKLLEMRALVQPEFSLEEKVKRLNQSGFSKQEIEWFLEEAE